MALLDILTAERVAVSGPTERQVCDKPTALQRLARLLASGQSTVTAERILEVLAERERLQSTGVGGGVAVPHGSVDRLDQQVGALLVCPRPIPFDAIDGRPVDIVFSLIVPENETTLHLNTIAGISGLCRKSSFLRRVRTAKSSQDLWEWIKSVEESSGIG